MSARQEQRRTKAYLIYFLCFMTDIHRNWARLLRSATCDRRFQLLQVGYVMSGNDPPMLNLQQQTVCVCVCCVLCVLYLSGQNTHVGDPGSRIPIRDGIPHKKRQKSGGLFCILTSRLRPLACGLQTIGHRILPRFLPWKQKRNGFLTKQCFWNSFLTQK